MVMPKMNNGILRLVVFDLDYTVWQPEMYQLYGSPRLVRAPRGMCPIVRQESMTSSRRYDFGRQEKDTDSCL